jgi:hypothetical protein
MKTLVDYADAKRGAPLSTGWLVAHYHRERNHQGLALHHAALVGRFKICLPVNWRVGKPIRLGTRMNRHTL